MRVRKRLIVNADGFGFGAGATQGIIDAIRTGGFISSVSVNANFPDAQRIQELIDIFPSISVGVHLNPMVGEPCLPVARLPSLVGADGQFHGSRFPHLLRSGRIAMAELEAEFNAQIGKVKDQIGSRLTHLDSQANSHLGYLDLFLALARKWNLRRMRNNASLICLEASRPRYARLRTYMRKPHVWLAHQYRKYQMRKARAAGMQMADHLITVGYANRGNKTKSENWLQILRHLPAGTCEIYCHPAYPDATLRRWASYCDDRAQELALLSRPELGDAARRLGVEIISFDAI